MKIRLMGALLTVPLLTGALVLAGCGKDEIDPADQGRAELGGASDINPVPRDQVRDGGNLRRALGVFPSNWNVLNNDGNYQEIASLMWGVMPRAFRISPAGETTVNTDFFTEAKLLGTNPEQVSYTINPKAVWSDGSPITWEDIKFQAQALSGRDTTYKIAASQGFDRVEKVERGSDDRQAILTFKQHFGEWQSQFAGNMMLYPKQVTRDPKAFNESLRDGPGLTAGPFIVSSIDKSAKRIVLSRNPKWWGDTPKLETMTYTLLSDEATVPALVNNEIDLAPLPTVDDLKNVRRTPGLAVRRAAANQWSHLTFNGAPGALLADPKLRVALVKGLDRQGLVTAVLNGLTDKPEPLGNHIYVKGQKGYQDNADAFDPAAAERELDALGWRRNGQFREKDGKRLEIKTLLITSEIGNRAAQIVQKQLENIGVKINIEPKPYTGYFENEIQPGKFDLAMWAWSGDAFSIGTLPQIYSYNPSDLQGNYGRIGSPEMNAEVEALVSELDPQRVLERANALDKKLWSIGFSVPLWQTVGNVGVRDNVVNQGAAGLASLDYTIIGFRK